MFTIVLNLIRCKIERLEQVNKKNIYGMVERPQQR